MAFKQIRDKSIDIAGQYDLSDDGKFVRKSGTEKEIPTGFPEKSKVEINGKSYGVRTLYWGSWNKALPGAQKQKSNAEKAGVTALKDFSTKDGKLFSKVIQNEIRELRDHRKTKKGTIAGQEIWTKKKRGDQIRFLVFNEAKGIILLRMYSMSWRDDFWFYDIETGKHKAFDKVADRDGSIIIWPEEI